MMGTKRRSRMAVGASLLLVGVNGLGVSALAHDDRDVPRYQRHVDCDNGGSISKALRRAPQGANLLVSGVCVENVEVPEGVLGVTLDGQGTATIRAADPSLDAVRIYGDGITVRGFTITGGRDAINLRGALNTLIDSNTLEGNGSSGINVHRVSFALIVNNVIRANGFHGIFMIENASARIGFVENTQAEPNIIEGNAVSGIYLARSANAAIAGNTIRNNGAHGVHLEKNAQAEVASNAIDANGLNGVFVTQNSGVHLGTPTGNGLLNRANSTTVNNTGFGVQCSVGAYMLGRLGTLNGVAGSKAATPDCIDTLP
jgi:parallel beta-helix repeat protein